jgi:hypothetical protein
MVQKHAASVAARAPFLLAVPVRARAGLVGQVAFGPRTFVRLGLLGFAHRTVYILPFLYLGSPKKNSVFGLSLNVP